MGNYYYYILFMMPAMILGLICQLSVKTTFSKYSKVMNRRGVNGEMAARTVLTMGVDGVTAYGVKIASVAGELTDHFDPKANVIRLSQPVYSANSVSAVGVAAHEAGHALQYADGYFMMKLRAAIIPVCNIGAGASPYLILLGAIFANEYLYLLGIIAYCTVALFQLVTLPVEFNASKRAMKAMEGSCLLTDDELKGARKVLTAAAMTYVAALFSSFMQILYYLSIMNDRKNRR